MAGVDSWNPDAKRRAATNRLRMRYLADKVAHPEKHPKMSEKTKAILRDSRNQMTAGQTEQEHVVVPAQPVDNHETQQQTAEPAVAV